MAKGNMLLGYNRGKLGDIVFKRLNGQSVQVPRVRNPHNPRTDAQTVQRIAFSSATKTAQALRGIVDHSFQGIKYGQTSVNHFVSRLTKEIKDFMQQSVNAGSSVAPFGTAPILPYTASGVGAGARALISNGDLIGMPYSLDATGLLVGRAGWDYTNMGTATVGDYESVFGVPGTDQVTIVEAIPVELDYVSETELFYGVRFGFLRWNLKQNVSSDTLLFTVGSASPYYKLNPAILDMERTDDAALNIEFKGDAGGLYLTRDAGDGASTPDGDVVGLGLAEDVCLAAVIVSRYESNIWRRSSSRLVLTSKTIQQSAVKYESEYGYNDIQSVIDLDVVNRNVPETEYLNKKKRAVT